MLHDISEAMAKFTGLPSNICMHEGNKNYALDKSSEKMCAGRRNRFHSQAKTKPPAACWKTLKTYACVCNVFMRCLAVCPTVSLARQQTA